MAPVIKSEDPTLGRFDNSHQKRRSDPGTIRQQASKAKIRPWDVSTTGNKSEDPTLGRFDNRDHLTSDNVSYLETLFRECTFRYLHIR